MKGWSAFSKSPLKYGAYGTTTSTEDLDALMQQEMDAFETSIGPGNISQQGDQAMTQGISDASSDRRRNFNQSNVLTDRRNQQIAQRNQQIQDARNKMRQNLKNRRGQQFLGYRPNMGGFMNQFNTNLQNLSANTGYSSVNY